MEGGDGSEKRILHGDGGLLSAVVGGGEDATVGPDSMGHAACAGATRVGGPREPHAAAVPHPSSRRRREERELPSRAGRGRIRQGEPGIRSYGGGSAGSRGRAVHDGRRRGWRREEVTADLAHRRPVAACRRGVEHPAGG